MAVTFKFKADGSGYKRGLDRMRRDTDKWSKGVKGMIAGAFGLAAINAAFKNIFTKFDRIHKLSKRFGASAESIQKLGFAAEQNGASMEIMAKAMAQGNRAAQEAANGLKTYQRAFDALNVDVTKFQNLDQESQMYALADAIKAAKNQNEAMAAAQQILGRSALELMPLLKAGSAAMKEQAESITTLGDVQVAEIARANDQMNKIKTDMLGSLAIWITSIMVGIQGMAAGATQAAVEISDAFRSAFKGIRQGLTGEFNEADKTIARMYERVKTAKDRIADTMRSVIDRDGKTSTGLGGSVIEEGGSAESKRLSIEQQITAERERQADATRTAEEKLAMAKKAWNEAVAKEFEAEDQMIQGKASKDEYNAAVLEQEKAYTKFTELRKKHEDELAQKKADALENEKQMMLDALDAQIAKQEEIDSKIAEKKEEARIKEQDKQKAEKELYNTKLNNISTSSPASIGGGGGVSAFTADPSLSEARRQTTLLGEISAKLEPSGGVEGTPEL